MTRQRKLRGGGLLVLAGVAACRTADHDPVLEALRTGELGRAAPANDAAPTERADASASLGTLDLAQALALAIDGRPELAAARAELAAAQHRAQASGQWPEANLVARAEAAPLEGRTVDDADLLVGIAQPLPLSARPDAERARADAEATRVAARVATVERSVVDAARGAFATALFTQHAAELRATLAAQAEALRAPVEARGAQGDATASERVHAALAARTAATAARIAERAATAARSELAAAIGRPHASIDAVAGDLATVLELPALERLAVRLSDHPALRAAHADAAAARAAITLARAERIPDLELELLYRRIGVDDVHAFDVGLSFPLRRGARSADRIAAAEAEERAARARGVADERTLVAELKRSHARLAAALATRGELRAEVLPLHDELVRIEAARLAAGDARPDELRRAQHARSEAELELLDATADALAAWAELRALVPEDAELR